MSEFNGKAINLPLRTGANYERFKVKLTPEFEALRVRAIELLKPFAEKELGNISETVTYFTVDGDDNSDDVCDKDECESEMLEMLKKDNPNSEIEINYSNNDDDHEKLNTCYICGRHLNTQLTWVRDELEYIKENELTKDFVIQEAFTLYCILDAIPSCDYDPSQWAINEYNQGRTFHVDLRTEFYEYLMQLTNSIVKILENIKL